MKKFDIKWLLILVLVVILAFGLVACNNGTSSTNPEDDDDGPANASNPTEFFTALWDSSKALGKTKVDPEKDKVHIGAEMDISLTSDTVSELDIGVKFGLVADLKAINTTDELGDTALMLQAYDKVTGDNWITLWYFIEDQDNIYLQVQDENFKVNFDAYWNEEFSALLRGLLAKDDIDLIKGNTAPMNTILGIINGVAKSGGDSWSLDTLIMGDSKFPGILAIFGLNLSELLNNDTVKPILSGMGITINTDGNISLGDILKTLGDAVLNPDTCTKDVNKDGSITYAASVDSSILGMLDGMLFGIPSNINLGLSFNTSADGKDIKGLTIEIAGKKNKLNNTTIKLNITDITIETTTGTKSDVTLKKANESSYKPYAKIAWEGYMDASKWGLQLDPDLDPTTANIKIGKVKVNLDATIDLTGAKASNKTAAQLTITNDIGGTAPEKVLTAIYSANTLTLETDLSTANNKAIAVEALYPLAKLIKKAAVGTAEEPVAAPYKIFGDMADEILAKMFTKADPTVADVNASFTTIKITNVDIATLAKGAFYAIFSDMATSAKEEKPDKAAELQTFDGKAYKMTSTSKETEDSQYGWELDVVKIVDAVLKAVKYNSTTKDYSLEVSNIKTTVLGVFKKGKNNKAPFAPADVSEAMALFMCTNDGLLLDLTKHGLLPLYKDGITDKYITSTYTPEQAVKDGYYSIPGKAISKADAEAIWAFLTGEETALKLSFEGEAQEDVYVADKDNATIAAYAANTSISWFARFLKGTTAIGTSDASNIVDTLVKDSAIKITLNRETGGMSCDIKLNNLSTTGYINYTISGSDRAYVPTATPVATTDANSVTVDLLDNYFYALFKAAFGMGPTTSLANNHGQNKDIYYFAESATYANSKFSAIEYKSLALIRVATETAGTYKYYVVTDTTAGSHGFVEVTIVENSTTIAITGVSVDTYDGTYNKSGSSYQVLTLAA